MVTSSQIRQSNTALGWWSADGVGPVSGETAIADALRDLKSPFFLVTQDDGTVAVARGGVARMGVEEPSSDGFRIVGYAPGCEVSNLGDRAFCADHGIRYPLLSGAMANGIASTEIVSAMGQAGMLGFFGAAGLPLRVVEAAIDRLQALPDHVPYGFNLIHSPNEPNLEAGVVDLYLGRGIHLVEASAYLKLTLPIVRFRVLGIHRDESGTIVTPNRIVAKASRVEVATRFFSPPPPAFLKQLVEAGEITEEQATLAASIPLAQDLTVEADSGGHTDNRPAIAVLPTMLALRDRMQSQHEYSQKLRVGLAGGISTPAAAAAAFAMGAAYVMTGSVNQSCREAGTSEAVRTMLAETDQADVMMAPAADMFEMGVKLQVVKRGTMFGMRATKLYELYRAYSSIDELPPADRSMLEEKVFRAPLEEIWESTVAFFMERDPSQVERAKRDPRHKMALIFRWYLGMSSFWANSGEPSRVLDYQIWCGPSMGAFNEWVKGSALEPAQNRSVETVSLNILYGGAVLTRIQTLRSQGVDLPPGLQRVPPLDRDLLMERLR